MLCECRNATEQLKVSSRWTKSQQLALIPDPKFARLVVTYCVAYLLIVLCRSGTFALRHK